MPRPRKRSGSRSIEKRLFILCEGKKGKSEYAYFESLINSCNFKGKKVEVAVIDSKKNTGRELVKEAKKHKEFPEDSLWVVYDKDGYTLHAETFITARDNNINIGFSSISFEYWILLHYEYTTYSFTKCNEVISYMKKKKYIDYSKSSLEIFDFTKDKLSTAITHARRIKVHQKKVNPESTPIYEYNPYTNLDELIEEIFKLQNVQLN